MEIRNRRSKINDMEIMAQDAVSIFFEMIEQTHKLHFKRKRNKKLKSTTTTTTK